MEDWVVTLEYHGSFTYCKFIQSLRRPLYLSVHISRRIYFCNVSLFHVGYTTFAISRLTWRCYPWCCLWSCPAPCWTARWSSQLAPWTPWIALLACWLWTTVLWYCDPRNKKLLLSKYHTAWHAVHVVDSAQGDGWLGNCAAGHDALLARGWWLGQLRAHPCGTVRPLYVWNRRNKLNNVMNDLIS